MFSDPVFEGIADERVDHVDQPLLGNLPNLVHVWEVINNDGIVAAPLHHICRMEAFVLGHREMLGLLTGHDYIE